MTDPTQVPLFKVTVITESLVDGSVHTTVFDKAEVNAQVIPPEAEIDTEEVIAALRENRAPRPARPPKVVIALQPHAREDGVWSHSTIEPIPLPDSWDD
jgi:hypothetical protein